MTKLEEVAAAIKAAQAEPHDALAPARAALRALRKPTEAMKAALHAALDENEFSPAAANNRPDALDRAVAAMMNAALKG